MSDLGEHGFRFRHHEDFTAPKGKCRLVKVVRSGDHKSGREWKYYHVDDFETFQLACERAAALTKELNAPRTSFTVYDDQRRILSR